MARNQLITPEGTKDFLFEEAALRRKVENKLRELFRFRNYHEVVTPSIEFMDVFSLGESIPVEQMYKLVDHKGRLLVLRPDSTMPIARICSTRLKNEPLPLRLSYHQSVFSNHPSLRGRRDEQLQSGIELIGGSGMKADLEVLVTALKAMKALDIPNYRIEIGHIGIIKSLLQALDVSEDDRETLRTYIEEKNYPALGDMLDRMKPEAVAKTLKRLPRMFGKKSVFSQARSYIQDEGTLQILRYLEELEVELAKLHLDDHITFDLGIVNRNDYYTGIIFKGYVEGCGEEVLSGGRYDALLQDFGHSADAIGFAIHVDAAVQALLPLAQPETAQTVYLFAEQAHWMDALEYADQLATLKIRTEFLLQDCLEDAVQFVKQQKNCRLDVVADSIQTFDFS